MSWARGRFLILFGIALAIPVLVWWPDLRSSFDRPALESLSYERLPMGEAPEPFTLLDPAEADVAVRMADGGRPTVVWFWSAMCPCIPDCEKRIRALIGRFPEERVRFFAVDPNPQDRRSDIERIRKELGSSYPVYRDPTARIVYRLGIETSASVAVFDRDGRLRFRGAIDDDIYTPTVSYVQRAVAGLLAGTPFEPNEAPPYGCAYPRLPDNP